MNRLALTTAMAFIVAAGCATDRDLGNRPRFINGTNNLTLLVYNGLTGGSVADADIVVHVGPHTLEAEANNGVYTVAQLPEGTFPVFVSANGFLNFAGTVNFPDAGNLNDPTSARTYLTRVVLLYPSDTVENDVVIRLYEAENGEPVPNGRLVAIVNDAAGLDGVGSVNDVGGLQLLTGAHGLRPSTIVVDITGGVATLPRAQLVLGATYSLDIFGARNAAGDYLLPEEDLEIAPGRQFHQHTLFLAPPSIEPVIALSASNEAEIAQPTLVVRFPYAVTDCTEEADITITSTGVTPNAATKNDDNPVTVALSDGGTTVTLSPNYDDAPDDEPYNVTFSGVKVQVVGSANCVDLFGPAVDADVQLRGTGAPVDGEIIVIADE